MWSNFKYANRILSNYFLKSNNYIAILLLVLISLKTLIVPVIYVDFELRKDFIIKNLCENRYKPQLKCNGTCYLAKKMNAVAEEKATNEAQKHSHNLKKVMEEIYDVRETANLTIFSTLLTKTTNYKYIINIPTGNCPAVFHPPAA